jgi:hypothetical protein
MKQLQIASMIILVIGIISFLLWRFILSIPDWFVRVTGIILLISIFGLVFSFVRLNNNKKKQIKNRN